MSPDDTMRILTASAALLACLASLPVPAAASGAGALEAKVSLEASLEKRVAAMLKEILGTERLVVIINVRLKDDEGEGGGPEILPGVPVRAGPESALRVSLTMVSNLAATVYVDERTQEADVALIRETAGALLGIDPKRGDVLEVKRQAFRREALPFSPLQLLMPPHVWNLLWLAVALLAVILMPSGVKTLAEAVRLHGDAVKTLQAPTAEGGESRREAEEAVLPAAAVPALEASGARPEGGGEPGQPFAFVREDHLPQLLYLLRKAPPELVAVVVHYLPSGMASRVLSALDESARRAVAASLGSVSELTETNVRKIEQFVRSKIDFMIGGEEKLLEILDNATLEVQKAILDDVLARDPPLAERLRGRLVRLEDLAGLESVELQGLIRRVGMATLAQVLRADPSVSEAVTRKLPPGLAERLGQEIQLARPAAKERLEADIRKVLAALKQLSAEGWVTLKRRPAEAMPASGAAPAAEARG